MPAFAHTDVAVCQRGCECVCWGVGGGVGGGG